MDPTPTYALTTSEIDWYRVGAFFSGLALGAVLAYVVWHLKE